MELQTRIVTKNPCYKAGKTITVKGLMLHSVGCPQPSAEVFVKKFDSADAKVCVHGFIDANTGVVYQTLPWEYRAWHCGGNANATHIGVEMCEPPCIKYTGGASFTCSDETRAKEYVRRALNSAVELFAWLCQKYNLNPLADGVIISHKEGHDRGLASGHGDPNHLFAQLHMDYSMDHFRKEVAAAMNGENGGVSVQVTSPPVNQPAANTPAPAVSATVKSPSAADQITAGKIVRLTADAVYYGGKEMPPWVLADRWMVKSVEGERVVLGKNLDGSHEINSPVNIRHVVVCTDTV